MVMRRRPLSYTLNKWQWTARDEFITNAVMKATCYVQTTHIIVDR